MISLINFGRIRPLCRDISKPGKYSHSSLFRSQPKWLQTDASLFQSNQNRNELVGSKSFIQDQTNDQKSEKEESSEKTLVSWSEYFARAIKTVVLKLFSLLISFFIW